MTTVRLDGITKSFGGREVLKGVNLDVEDGQIVALIGPSGCGKTTLFKCILGERLPDSGRVVFGGEEVTALRVEKRRVGIVYQDYALFPHLTVAENIGYGMKVRGDSKAAIARRVAELLELIQLPHRGDAMPRTLSGGEQQRVALARALAVEPRLLLLDEAFTALDPTIRTTLVQQVRRIIQRMGITTILVTHDQEEAFLFASHVVVLNEGQVVVTGPPEEVMKHPHPFVQEFVKMVLFHKATVSQDEAGNRFVQVQDGPRIPVAIESVSVGDEVHIMVKKGPEKESVEVWPVDKK